MKLGIFAASERPFEDPNITNMLLLVVYSNRLPIAVVTAVDLGVSVEVRHIDFI